MSHPSRFRISLTAPRITRSAHGFAGNTATPLCR